MLPKVGGEAVGREGVLVTAAPESDGGLLVLPVFGTLTWLVAVASLACDIWLPCEETFNALHPDKKAAQRNTDMKNRDPLVLNIELPP